MNTAEQMTTELQDVFAKLKSGEIKHNDAAQLANLAGKMVSMAKIQLQYHQDRKETPEMAFFSKK